MNDDNTTLPNTASPARRADQNPTPHRILVVDDESAVRNLISNALTPCGYDVEAAEDGAAAWEAIQAKKYDLLITDNNMPKVSGVELLEKLHAAATPLPVIMATGEAPEHEFRRKPWLQPKATLIKPFTIPDLRETVKKILQQESSSDKGGQSYA